MKLYKHSDMLRGWFVGGFQPTCHYTKDFEVQYREYDPGHTDDHYHTVVTEVNLVVSGQLRIQGKLLSKGDIFVLDPYEISNPEFLEPTAIVCVKYPSMNDKVTIHKDVE